jgi:hypothetical protein
MRHASNNSATVCAQPSTTTEHGSDARVRTRSLTDEDDKAVPSEAVFGPWRQTNLSTGSTNTTAILIFLEDADSVAVAKGTLPTESSASVDQSWVLKAGEWLLDRVVRNFQAAPKVAHVEVLLVDDQALSGASSSHFSTYIGDRADWRDSDSFYSLRKWRAIPIGFAIPPSRLREFMEQEVDAPYSIGQYFASLRLTSFIRWAWEARVPGTAAHCATLATRIIQRALLSSTGALSETQTTSSQRAPTFTRHPNEWCLRPRGVLAASPCTYSPSSLFVECAKTCQSQANGLLEHDGETLDTRRSYVHDSLTAVDLNSRPWMTTGRNAELCHSALRTAAWNVGITLVESGDEDAMIDAQRELASLAIRLVTPIREGSYGPETPVLSTNTI